MITVTTPEAMPDDDLHVYEKRWQRKRLFRKQPTSSVPYLVAILVIIIALAVLLW